MNAIDLARVRKGRAELARLARTYPELRGERSAANVEHWIETLESIGDEKVGIAKTCEFCGEGFVSMRKDARFCSDVHRAAFNRRKDERGPSELAEKLMKAAQAYDLALSSVGFPDAAKHKRVSVAALRDVLSAIEAELGIVHAAKDEPSPEPEQLVLTIPSTPDQVRENLRAFMAKHTIGQTRVAELCGASQSQISRFLAGSVDLSPEYRKAIETMIEKESNRSAATKRPRSPKGWRTCVECGLDFPKNDPGDRNEVRCGGIVCLEKGIAKSEVGAMQENNRR